MKKLNKVILTPNPYRDKNFQTVREAMAVLADNGIDARICLPFEVDRTYDLPRYLIVPTVTPGVKSDQKRPLALCVRPVKQGRLHRFVHRGLDLYFGLFHSLFLSK